MRLIHYSEKPIDKLDHRIYDNSHIHNCGAYKPAGLWVSAETDDQEDINWQQWCILEDFRVENLQYAYSIKLYKNANVLHIDTLDKLLDFKEKYHCLEADIIPAIDWNSVSSNYQGIIIQPYRSDYRFRWQLEGTMIPTVWYYGWECASGCIWDINAIKSFENEGV